MFEHITLDIILLLMLYAVGATVSAMACVYLLLRRGNAFTRRISTPKRLRRWTAAFFGILTAGHLWYLPGTMMADGDAAVLWMLIGALLDCMLTMPLALVVMLCMLQDRKRPLWIAWLITAPLVILSAVSVGMRSYALVQWMQGYFLLMAVGFTAYMVRQVRQYGRWLRDNYADLEHKEVWQSLLVLAVIILLFCYYVVGYGSITYEFIIQLCGIVLVAYLLWRVETLQDLSFQPMADGDIALAEAQRVAAEAAEADDEADDDALDGDGGRLQPAEGQSIQAKQLAAQSGYRSYRTFSVAFKQRTGQSVKDWIAEQESALQADKQ